MKLLSVKNDLDVDKVITHKRHNHHLHCLYVTFLQGNVKFGICVNVSFLICRELLLVPDRQD